MLPDGSVGMDAPLQHQAGADMPKNGTSAPPNPEQTARRRLHSAVCDESSVKFTSMRRFILLLLSLALWAASRNLPAQSYLDAPSGPLVISERWPQATDLVSWTRDVMRLERLENASETAQAKAFFAWLRLFSRMAVGGMIQPYEGDYGHEIYVTDEQKTLFVYGWGYCDTFSRIAEAAWQEFKHDPRSAERVCVQHADGGYHTMYRLR